MHGPQSPAPYGAGVASDPTPARDDRSRKHLLAGSVLAVLAVLATLAGTSADANDRLHQRRHNTAERVKTAHRSYDAASGRYLRAHAALRRARDELDDARSLLQRRRAELHAARGIYRRTQHELLVANQRLDDARAQLTGSRQRIKQLQLQWKRQLITEYQSGGVTLNALSTVLNGTDPSDLMGRLAGLDAIAASHDATLSRATAALALERALKAELEAARAEVRKRADEAALQLRQIRATESAAQSARDDVRLWVDRRREATATAAAVRAREAAQLRRLEAEQAQIEQMLRRRSAAAERSGGSRRSTAPATGWPWPVNGWVSTPFGWRIHPIYGYRSFHNGIDIAAACGTPVRAPAAGTVLQTYFQTAYGNRVLIDHGAPGGVGTASEYNHLDRWTVTPGQRVAPGQIIGYVGSTGWSTGCHLHFTIYKRGIPVNPLPLLG